MQFWLGMSVTVVGVFAAGALFGWWLRAVAYDVMEAMPDIWPGERRS